MPGCRQRSLCALAAMAAMALAADGDAGMRDGGQLVRLVRGWAHRNRMRCALQAELAHKSVTNVENSLIKVCCREKNSLIKV